jgi:signal transduction histidine kinase/CheY-like chemotaxis protein
MGEHSGWSAWVERLLPAGLDDEAKLRSRFYVQGWSITTAISVLQVGLYVAGGMWSQVVINCGLVLSGPILLWLHRRGAAFERLVHVSLGIVLFAIGAGTLAQKPADFSLLSLMIAAPLLAGLLMGARRALIWLVVSLVLTVATSIAAGRDWVFDYTDPTPTLSRVLNISIGLALGWVVASAFQDVRERALERLREVDRARSAFLANISHEIRTPMNGVLGMTEVMLQEVLSASQREQLSIIQRSGRTLVALINDLLDVSKMEAGKLQLEQRDFNLSTVLADVNALNAPNAASKGLSFTVTKAPAMPARLHGDGLRLGQVLTNLLSNAVKFTSKGEVRLEVTLLPGSAHGKVRCGFAVTDTGEGIPADVLPRLFTAFEQADSSTTRRFGGTGLGLALSAQLVALMGGRIQVASRIGVGSCFSFEVTFGEAVESHTGELAVVPLRPAPGGCRRQVLVVDDNPINLKVALSLVEKAGFTAEGAVNGKVALEAVKRGTYALVLMDCHMPEMDGFEATEHIRALEGAARHTPVVALTASAMPEEIAACHRAGMNSVLTKPLTFVALCEMLQQQVV